MHTVTFYPVGNGDTSQIILENGKRILFDFNHVAKGESDEHPEIDLKKCLRDDLNEAKRDYFDVVAFTHADKDHISGSTEFFELEHAEKYKGDDRIKIRELWVPAAMLLERGTNEDQSAEYILLRQEARYRLKQRKGILVFSRPPDLKKWMEDNQVDYETRKHLFVDAGTLVPGFSLGTDNVEFFCHSPFIEHCDGFDFVRNDASLIFNIRFRAGTRLFDYLAVGDSSWKILEDIVAITQYHGREHRLAWDLFSIPHHCSAFTLSDDKGEKETIPVDGVKTLLLSGKKDAYIVSSSRPIPDNTEAYEQAQPPHIQARKAYERYRDQVGARRFLVTMEEPYESEPKPLVFEFTSTGHLWKKMSLSGSAAILASPPPRAG